MTSEPEPSSEDAVNDLVWGINYEKDIWPLAVARVPAEDVDAVTKALDAADVPYEKHKENFLFSGFKSVYSIECPYQDLSDSFPRSYPGYCPSFSESEEHFYPPYDGEQSR